MNLHHLKTWPIPFTAIWDGLKPFEIRKDDRNFQVGDELVLQIWDPFTKTYGRRTIEATVTYKTADERWGLLPGHCVLGLGNIRRILRAGRAEPGEPEGECSHGFDAYSCPHDHLPAPKPPARPVMGFTRINYEAFQKHLSDLEPSRLARLTSALEMYRSVASSETGDDRSPKDGPLSASLLECRLAIAKIDVEEWRKRALAAEEKSERLVEANHILFAQRDEALGSLRNAHANVRDLQAQLTSDAEARRVEREALQAAIAILKRDRGDMYEAHRSEHDRRCETEKLLTERTRERDEYLARWRETHRAASRAATESERRRAEGEGRMGSPAASEQPRGMSETMVRVTAMGDGPDTRRCTRWYEPKGTVGEMLEELTRVAPTKTPYRAYLRDPSLPEGMTPIEPPEGIALAGLIGKHILAYAEGREADRLAYSTKSTPANDSPARGTSACPICGVDSPHNHLVDES